MFGPGERRGGNVGASRLVVATGVFAAVRPIAQTARMFTETDPPAENRPVSSSAKVAAVQGRGGT